MIELKDISVIYENQTQALDSVNIKVSKGEFVGIIGLSGSGKSTLIKTINLLVKPSKGKIIIDDDDIIFYSEEKLRKLRREIGFVFQEYNLVERSSVLKNVLIGRLGYQSNIKSFFGIFKEEDYILAEECIKEVNLEEKLFMKGSQLSGGQKQRVAIAKTLCQKPKLILADEPVASLDQKSAKNVMNCFKEINDNRNITMIINLHDVNLAKKYCKRLIGLKDGKVLFDKTAGDVSDNEVETLYN